jgi:hypothetical protein
MQANPLITLDDSAVKAFRVPIFPFFPQDKKALFLEIEIASASMTLVAIGAA